VLRSHASLAIAAARKMDLHSQASSTEVGACDSDDDAAVLFQQKANELRAAAKRIQPRRVVVYNARHDGADLVDGLLKAFNTDPSFFLKHASLWERLAEVGGTVADLAGLPGAEMAGKSIARSLASRLAASKPLLKDVMETFIRACEAEGSYPCLVVDEVRCSLA